MEDDPLFRRTRQHAEKRLIFSGAKSDKQRLVDIKEFLRLEKEMLFGAIIGKVTPVFD